MKPITFENLRRLMGGGRKKKEKESSFKRSDSFKRISIRKSYLDRGKKKVIPKLEVATQTVSEEELLGRIPEEVVVKKVDSSVQVDKVDLNATIKSGKEIVCNNFRISKSPDRNRGSGNSVVAYSHWLQEIKREDPPITSAIKGSERTIIYVPASDDRVPSPVIRQLSSSPNFRKKNTSKTHICNSPNNLQRKESNDSAVEMFPWGDSTEVKKSPLVRRRSRQSPVSLLPTDSGSEEMCSLSISLGRIWMDAPQVMAPRSLEMPAKTSASNTPPAHHSLDSALKDLRDDPLVSNRLQKRSTPPVTRTLSSTSNNTASTGLFSSKDSGFSFSISAPKLSDFHANFSPDGGKGFFRKKSRPKPKLSVSRDGYFKRTSSALVVESKRNSVRRRSSRKKKGKGKKNKTKDKDSGTIRSDIYQVICSRPQRVLTSLKLDPMIFVPPEKRKNGSHKPPFRTKIQEIRSFNPLDSSMYSTTRSMDSTDEGLYESLPGDYDYLTDDEEINLESFSMEKKECEVVCERRSFEMSGGNMILESERHMNSGYGVVRKYFKSRVGEGSKSTTMGDGGGYVTKDIIFSKDLGNHRKDMYDKNKCRYSICHILDESRRYQKKSNDHKHRREEESEQLMYSKDFNCYRDPPNDTEDYSEDEDSLVSVVSDNFSDTDSENCANVYVPPGVSPVPRRRPVRRKKSIGLSHKRSITYLVKPTVIRAPSTLKRHPKKIGKKSKQSKQRDQESNGYYTEDFAQDVA